MRLIRIKTKENIRLYNNQKYNRVVAVEATMKNAPLAILILTTALSLSPTASAQKAVADPGKQHFFDAPV
jgi:hypothetical protein